MLSRGSKLARACKPAVFQIAPRVRLSSSAVAGTSGVSETLKMKVQKINEHTATVSSPKHKLLRAVASYSVRGAAMYAGLYMSSYMIVAAVVSAADLGEPLLQTLHSIDSAAFQQYIAPPKANLIVDNPNVVATAIVTNLLDVVLVPATAYLTHKWVQYARLRDAERQRVVPDSYTHLANPNMPAKREKYAPVE